MQLSIVIPAFNEAERLPTTLAAIEAFCGSRPDRLPAEVIVIDDGSSDQTDDVAERIPRTSGVERHIVRHASNRGKGAAVRTGFHASRGHRVLLSDADLATPIEELDRLADLPVEYVAIGSRALDRSLIETRQPWWRDHLGRGFNLIVRTLVRLPFRDTQCGFKLFPGWFARSAAASLETDGFAFDVELLVLAAAWDVPVSEIGVRWRHVELSRVSAGRHSLAMFHEVLRIRRRVRSGRLPSRPVSSLEAGP